MGGANTDRSATGPEYVLYSLLALQKNLGTCYAATQSMYTTLHNKMVLLFS